jgi:uncharacterized protein (TIGR03083 family)
MAEELGYNPPQPVSEILLRIEEEWGPLLAVLASVPAELIAQPGVCGSWSVKDLIGHVAFWDRQVVDDIDGYIAGRPPLGNPWQEWNAAEAEKRAGLSLDELRREMADNHAKMLERLQEVAEIDPRMVAIDTWEHYQEHAAEIEQWLSTHKR